MNICSNQIKEVILHRFKVKTLQKLLIHINFLLAFSVLFCSHSAYGQSGPAVSATYTIDSMVVDLGFVNFYWSKRNLGAENNNETYPGNYKSDFYDFYDVETATNAVPQKLPQNRQYSVNRYWRVPYKNEVDSLINKSTARITKAGVYFTRNNNTILIPASGYYNGITNRYSGLAYFWTATALVNKNYAYRFLGGKGGLIEYVTLSAGGTGGDYESFSPQKFMKLPIRPVIDKCQITVKIFEDGTQINEFVEYVPKGTRISLEANANSCYKVHWAIENSNLLDSYNYTISRLIEKSETYIANFTVKTTNIRATTDSSKGWVGLNVWK